MRAICLCAALFTMLAPYVVTAAEIPESVHRAYLRGATSVTMPSGTITLPLSGTGWTGHYRSPYLTVFVNGHGPFTFLFDTGASVTIISSKVAKAASVAIANKTAGHHTILRAGEIRAGSIVMRDYYAVLGDGDDVDGILGFNAFGSNALTFDFGSRTLRVSHNSIALPGAFWLPYSLSHHLPVIDLYLGRKTLPTLIDTGDDAYGWEGTPADLKGLLFDHVPVTGAMVFNGETGATKTTVTAVDGTLHLGPLSAERPVVAINPSLPLPDIGMDVIDQFDLEFDRAAKHVAFAPRFAGRRFRVPGELTCGVYISFARKVRRITRLSPDLVSKATDMAVADPIVRIDGKPAGSVTYERWDRAIRERQPVSLVWSHAGKLHSAAFSVIERQ